jgi:DNA-binding MarR family transcriptional regulator
MPRSRQRPEPGHPLLQLGLEQLDGASAERVRLFRLITTTGMLLRARLDRELAPHGLTTQQAALLQHVEGHEEPPTMSAIARAMAMTHQNVRQLVDVLVRKKFLAITPDPNDGRARRLVLTAHHHRFWQKRNPGDFGQVRAWTAALNDREVSSTIDALMRLHLSLRDDR